MIPPDLDIADPDGGVGPSPKIMASGPAPEFSIPGPLVLEPGDERKISLTIQHVDVDATLHVRFYVDYNLPDPTPVASSCSAPPTGQVERVVDCSTASLCVPGDTEEHLLSAMVADQAFLDETATMDTGQLPYRGIPAGAGWDREKWILQCNSAQ